MTTIQTTLTEKTYFAIGSAPFTDYRDKLPGTEVIYDREQAQLNPTKVEIQLAHASRGTTHAVVHIDALDQTPARELAEQEAAAEAEAAAQEETEQETEQEVTFDEVADLLGYDLPERTHINSISAQDLKGRTTAHSRFIARDLGINADSVVDASDGLTVAVLPRGYVLTITTYDAIGLGLGADMILKYELVSRDTKFDMLPVNTTAEATEILRKVINRAG